MTDTAVTAEWTAGIGRYIAAGVRGEIIEVPCRCPLDGWNVNSNQSSFDYIRYDRLLTTTCKWLATVSALNYYQHHRPPYTTDHPSTFNAPSPLQTCTHLLTYFTYSRHQCVVLDNNVCQVIICLAHLTVNSTIKYVIYMLSWSFNGGLL